jgi:Tc5 transposase DNA-binding domain
VPLPSLYATSSVPSEYPFPLFPGPPFSPRAHSPAHSVASAITSLTEGTSIRSDFDRPPFKYPAGDALQKLIGKPRKQRLFNHQRKEICLYHQQNPGIRQEDIANKWGVERSTVSKILKQKSKWLNVPDGEEPHTAKHRYVSIHNFMHYPKHHSGSHRPSKFPEIESELAKWLYECREKKVQLTDSVIRNKAKEVAKQLQIPEDKFKASSGWVENFKHRHGIRRGQFHGNGRNARLGRLHGVAAESTTAHFGLSITDYLVQDDLYAVEDTLRRSPTPRPGNVSVDSTGAGAGADTGGGSQGGGGGPDCSLPPPVRVGTPTRASAPSGLQSAGSDGAPSSALTSLTSASSDQPPADLTGRYPAGVTEHVPSANQEYPHPHPHTLPLTRQRQQRMHVFDCYAESLTLPIPSAGEALEAVEKVMHFMDSQYKEEDALSECQRRTLLHIHMKITELKGQPLSSAEDAAHHEL